MQYNPYRNYTFLPKDSKNSKDSKNIVDSYNSYDKAFDIFANSSNFKFAKFQYQHKKSPNNGSVYCYDVKDGMYNCPFNKCSL